MTQLVEAKKMPHLLFYGPPGTGKTSTILAIAKGIYGNNIQTMALQVTPSTPAISAMLTVGAAASSTPPMTAGSAWFATRSRSLRAPVWSSGAPCDLARQPPVLSGSPQLRA